MVKFLSIQSIDSQEHNVNIDYIIRAYTVEEEIGEGSMRKRYYLSIVNATDIELSYLAYASLLDYLY